MKGFYRAAGPLRQVGRSWPSNPQESGQNFKISALKSAKKGQRFDDFWASNPQNRGQETSEASRGLLLATLQYTDYGRCPQPTRF